MRPKMEQQPWGRTGTSWVIAVGNAVMAVLYSNPEVLVRRPIPGGRHSLVAYIEQFGPVWVSAFGVSSVILIIALVARRLVSGAHSLSAAVWSGYSTAVLWSALSNSPRGPFLAASLALIVAIINFTLVIAYVDFRDRE